MHRNHAHSDWRAKAATFVAASAIGGALSGAVLGATGSLIPYEVRLSAGSVLAVVAILAGVVVLLGRNVVLVQCDRETPQSWIHRGPSQWAIVNGLSLGCGAFTRIGFVSWYVVPLAVLLIGRVDAGVIIFGTYGLARGLGAGALIGAGAFMKRHGVAFDDLALWVLMRQSAARWVSGAQVAVLGIVTVLLVGL